MYRRRTGLAAAKAGGGGRGPVWRSSLNNHCLAGLVARRRGGLRKQGVSERTGQWRAGHREQAGFPRRARVLGGRRRRRSRRRRPRRLEDGRRRHAGRRRAGGDHACACSDSDRWNADASRPRHRDRIPAAPHRVHDYVGGRRRRRLRIPDRGLAGVARAARAQGRGRNRTGRGRRRILDRLHAHGLPAARILPAGARHLRPARMPLHDLRPRPPRHGRDRPGDREPAQILLDVEGDDILAVGTLGILYGFRDNLADAPVVEGL